MSVGVFRKADKKDLAVLSVLAHEMNRRHGDDQKPSVDDLTTGWGRFEVYVVEHDGIVAGFLAGYNTYQFHAARPGFEIQNLFVRESFRGQGLGQMLMEEAIRIKKEEGICRFSLQVHENNREARSLYAALGFRDKPRDHVRCILEQD